jgi:hypothetical protein
MRTLILAAMLTLGTASAVDAGVCRDPATGRRTVCATTYGAAMPGIGRTVVVATPPAVAVRPVGRYGRYRVARRVASPVTPAPAPVRQPAPGYAPQ